jgi:predicted nuclease with RNAse H fold
MRLRLIGIDCATKSSNAGVAAAWWHDGTLDITDAFVGKTSRPMNEEFPSRIREIVANDAPALFALDAPLGWPAPLADGLRAHAAGERLNGSDSPGRFFRRLTDLRVRAETKKTPLEVGANFIARTAFAALELLAALRVDRKQELELLWSPGIPARSGAIEVYPAATLLAHGAGLRGYKSDVTEEWEPARTAIVDMLATRTVNLAQHQSAMIECDHIIDAVACVLGAADFLRGDVVLPTEEELPIARREGWIWFKRPHTAAMDSPQ